MATSIQNLSPKGLFSNSTTAAGGSQPLIWMIIA
jgi:hypothetical protein